jgi:hypothetical protein
MKDTFRVSPTGKLPMLHPFNTTKFDTSPASKKLANSLGREILETLSKTNITFKRQEVVTLGRSGYPGIKKDTLVLETSDAPKDPWEWYWAANQIQDLIDNAAEKQSPAPSLRVQIRNPDRMYQPSYCTVPLNTELCKKLLVEQLVIDGKVKQLIPNYWKTIGYSDLVDKDHRVKTLMIVVLSKTILNWSLIDDCLIDSLKTLIVGSPRC